MRQSEPRRLFGLGDFGQDALASDAPRRKDSEDRSRNSGGISGGISG